MLQRDAADLQANPAFEFVGIPAVSDSHAETLATDLRPLTRAFFFEMLIFESTYAKIRGCLYPFRKNSASSKSSGVVILMFLGEPITTATCPPARSTKDASSVPVKPSAIASSKAFFSTS